MYRHQVRFVLRFGVRSEFTRVLGQLAQVERKRAWSPQRVWRATAGRMNEVVIEHDYDDRDAYHAQRDAYAAAGDDEFDAALAELTELIVPGTAVETALEWVSPLASGS